MGSIPIARSFCCQFERSCVRRSVLGIGDSRGLFFVCGVFGSGAGVRVVSSGAWRCSLAVVFAEIAAVAQLVEYVLGKDGVMGSSPISSFSAWIDVWGRLA